jgi:hypothetical protein
MSSTAKPIGQGRKLVSEFKENIAILTIFP